MTDLTTILRDLSAKAAGFPLLAEAICDLNTHRSAWSSALEIMLGDAAGTDSESYWKHELRAFDRTIGLLTRYLAACPNAIIQAMAEIVTAASDHYACHPDSTTHALIDALRRLEAVAQHLKS